jgi:hypothetical protein
MLNDYIEMVAKSQSDKKLGENIKFIFSSIKYKREYELNIFSFTKNNEIFRDYIISTLLSFCNNKTRPYEYIELLDMFINFLNNNRENYYKKPYTDLPLLQQEMLTEKELYNILLTQKIYYDLSTILNHDLTLEQQKEKILFDLEAIDEKDLYDNIDLYDPEIVNDLFCIFNSYEMDIPYNSINRIIKKNNDIYNNCIPYMFSYILPSLHMINNFMGIYFTNEEEYENITKLIHEKFKELLTAAKEFYIYNYKYLKTWINNFIRNRQNDCSHEIILNTSNVFNYHNLNTIVYKYIVNWVKELAKEDNKDYYGISNNNITNILMEI